MIDVEAWADSALVVRGRSHGRRGVQIVCECPDCGRPKLYVHARTGVWICYRCHDSGGRGSGSFVRLYATAEGLTTGEARKRLKRATIRPRASRMLDRRGREVEAAPELNLPPDFVPLYRPGVGWTIPDYLRERKIRLRLAQAYGVGTIPFGSEHLLRGRLVFPIRGPGERLEGLQGRTMGKARAKYLTHPDTEPGALFGYPEAVAAARLLVVEGPVDVLRLRQRGLDAVALLGKTCSPAQAVRIAQAVPEEVVILLDGGAKERRAAREIEPVLRGVGVDALVADLPDGVDPGDGSAAEIQGAISRARRPKLSDRIRALVQ